MTRTLFKLFLVTVLFTTSSFAATEYGELYLIEDRSEDSKKSFQIGTDYSYEFTNPYLSIHGLTISAAYRFSRHFRIGLQGQKYFAKKTTLTRSIEEVLESNDISQIVLEPTYSGYGILTIVPLSGQLNFFSLKNIPVDLVLSGGAGVTQYQNIDKPVSAVTWSIGPEILFSNNFGIRLTGGQQIEDPFGSARIARFEGKVGTLVRF